jgi:hypothetical protein
MRDNALSENLQDLYESQKHETDSSVILKAIENLLREFGFWCDGCESPKSYCRKWRGDCVELETLE